MIDQEQKILTNLENSIYFILSHRIALSNYTKECYKLIGILMGYTIRDNNLLSFEFAPFIYKKILGLECTNENFKNDYKFMLNVLSNESETTDINFNIFFQIDVLDSENTIKPKDLKPNGGSIGVTKDNYEEYKELLINFYLNESVDSQINIMREWFLQC